MSQLDRMQGVLRWTWVLVALVVLYAGYIFVSRWSDNRGAEKEVEKKQVEANRPAVELLGNGEPKVLSFYGNPPKLRQGEPGLLCYGVVNVKSVSIVPGVEEIKPSLGRCVPIKPTATTSYTLTGVGEKGSTVTQTIEIEVLR